MKELKRSIFFISLPIGFISLIFPIYALDIGVHVLQLGFLFSIFSVVSTIIRPIVGNLIDKKGRKIGILLGIIFYTLVNLVYIFANDFKHLLMARILQSLGTSFLWISVDTFISDISQDNNRGKSFGIIGESESKGGLLGSIIGFSILTSNYFKDPFMAVFIIFTLSSLVSLFYGIKDVPETIGLKKDLKSGKVKDKKVLLFFLCIMGMLTLIGSLTAPVYFLYLQDHITNDLSLILSMLLPSAILSTFLPNKLGNISDKYGREKIVFIGLFANAMLQIMIPFNQSYYGFMLIYTMISIVGMFYGPALSSLVIDFVGENKRGRSYGLYSFATGIGAAIGSIIGSYIYQNIGGTVFHLKGVLMIVMVLFVCYIYIRKLAFS